MESDDQAAIRGPAISISQSGTVDVDVLQLGGVCDHTS